MKTLEQTSLLDAKSGEWKTVSWCPVRHIAVQLKFTDDGVMHKRELQEIPDNFFDYNRHLEDLSTRSTNTQDHMQSYYRMPSVMKNQWIRELGNPLHTDSAGNYDQDVEKRWKDRLNSNEYRKIRTGGGNL